jgi:hypothetical protein
MSVLAETCGITAFLTYWIYDNHPNVSRRGVVTLPAKLRQALGIQGDDQIEVRGAGYR